MSTKKDFENRKFKKECANNNLEHIKDFIKKDTELKLNLKKGFLIACMRGSLSVVKYLLETPNVKERIDLNSKCEIFKWRSISNSALIEAYMGCHLETVDYLLFNMNINVSEDTKKSLQFSGTKDLLDKIEKRDLFFKINEEMNKMSEELNISEEKKYLNLKYKI